MNAQRGIRLTRQRGASAVEFALIAPIFLTVLIGIMEMGRIFFYLNTASEATRLGARLAVVCDANDPVITQKMGQMLPMLTPGLIDINYAPAGCAGSVETARATCLYVTVRVKPTLPLDTFMPFVPFSVNMPPFATTLPRESLDSTNNPVCQTSVTS